MPATEQRGFPPHSGSRRGRGLLVGALALLLVAVLIVAVRTILNAPEAGTGAPGGGAGAVPPAAVFVKRVETETTQAQAKVTGTLRAASRAEISALEPGAVKEVLVDEGDAVQAGAVLARLDARRVQARLAEAEAALTSAKSLVRQREAERKRAEDDLQMKTALLKEKAVSRSDVLDARRALVVAEAQQEVAGEAVEEMTSSLRFLTVQYEDLEITAPFSGLIVERHTEPGEWLSAGDAVVSLVSIDPVEAWLRVPARFRSALAADPDRVRVRLSSTGGIFAPAEVTIVPDVETRSQLFTVIATLDNKERRLVSGESVTGIVPVGERAPHWKFPLDALVRTPMGDHVFVADPAREGGLPSARKISIDLAFERDGEAFVKSDGSGLAANDQLVVEGNERLIPGQRLMVETQEDQPGRGAPGSPPS